MDYILLIEYMCFVGPAHRLNKQHMELASIGALDKDGEQISCESGRTKP